MNQHFEISHVNSPHSSLPLLFVRQHADVAAAEDWPVVRGDMLGSGVAKAVAARQARSRSGRTKRDEDAGFDATAVIADGVIYVGDNAGTFHAVRLADGTAGVDQAISRTAASPPARQLTKIDSTSAI